MSTTTMSRERPAPATLRILSGQQKLRLLAQCEAFERNCAQLEERCARAEAALATLKSEGDEARQQLARAQGSLQQARAAAEAAESHAEAAATECTAADAENGQLSAEVVRLRALVEQERRRSSALLSADSAREQEAAAAAARAASAVASRSATETSELRHKAATAAEAALLREVEAALQGPGVHSSGVDSGPIRHQRTLIIGQIRQLASRSVDHQAADAWRRGAKALEMQWQMEYSAALVRASELPAQLSRTVCPVLTYTRAR
jgi:hypothetical protein